MKTLINDSIEDLEAAIKSNIDLQEKFKINPVDAIRQVEIRNPKDTDYWIYRIIVLMLGLAIIAIIAGLILLSVHSKEKPDSQLVTIFATISSGAIGALAGLLSPSPRK
ncbi:hypothetical protein C1637_04670 [Chryseobacterium lactis]|uniref:Uncharacterized protein n=1 Tax=Chryseobacterium lactis TaxID=1241981 RepID=A0A3G6RRD1_CHRLC|nr:hypothetical protein [Chryseobacterium lactis]AZA81871.1 hypothetical protein EG342_08060 [Chryseobacterium lactis]AZB06868.1 hypothetical protein EG341_24175 [Chryseobacterium lactis]PNW15721.1 hypothetical protein C1637_04670 [Chryseobacterium lactis]